MRLLLIILIGLFIFSCKKNDPAPSQSATTTKRDIVVTADYYYHKLPCNYTLLAYIIPDKTNTGMPKFVLGGISYDNYIYTTIQHQFYTGTLSGIEVGNVVNLQYNKDETASAPKPFNYIPDSVITNVYINNLKVLYTKDLNMSVIVK